MVWRPPVLADGPAGRERFNYAVFLIITMSLTSAVIAVAFMLLLGLLLAAVLAIAESLGVRRIATTDRRDFGAVAKELSLELVP